MRCDLYAPLLGSITSCHRLYHVALWCRQSTLFLVNLLDLEMLKVTAVTVEEQEWCKFWLVSFKAAVILLQNIHEDIGGDASTFTACDESRNGFTKEAACGAIEIILVWSMGVLFQVDCWVTNSFCPRLQSHYVFGCPLRRAIIMNSRLAALRYS